MDHFHPIKFFNGINSSGNGPELYDIKSRKASTAPGSKPGFKIISTISSVTLSLLA